MTVVVPTTDSVGWVKDLAQMADRLMSYAMTSNYSQSSLYPNRITSIPWIIKVSNNDPYTLEQNLRDALQGYFGRYFDIVEVEVLVSESNDTYLDESGLTIRLDLNIVHQGYRHSLGRLIQTVNSQIVVK